ncbi:hypothetical protein [Actinotalea solisilvae]|uniref:hypothetical protein n=1 Tax=Actinotalea solisilvae TaxID=2072922 RepID=UPI0018F1582C|nr:hypothetical protein [Actinotalea solisilvae]
MIGWEVLLAGALVGSGITVVAAGLVPSRPQLAAALARLDPRVSRSETPPASGALAGVRARTLPRLVEGLGLRRFSAELAVTEQTVEALAARKVGYALVGLAFPPMMAALLAVAGVSAPPVLPVGVGLVSAGVLSLVPDVELRRRAATARAAMRRATCVYLELVALERAADAGATEALERAATVGRSREFQRIREALLTAEVTGRPAWDGLYRLADDTGVVELADLADIMRLSGTDGAAVYGTLRARATSLRTQLLATASADANAASEHMTIPVALLGVAFMALIALPAFARIFTG